jgi:hypothetical protein
MQSKAINRRRKDNTMTKEKMAKGHITIYKSLHIKLKLEQYKPHSKPESELRCCGSNKQFQKQDINIIF